MASVSCASFEMEPNDMASPVAKTLDDFFSGLDFFERNRLLRLFDFEQAAQRGQLAVLCVDERRILFEALEAFSRGDFLDETAVLQSGDGVGIVEVVFALGAELIIASNGQLRAGLGSAGKRMAVLADGLFGEHVQAHAADAGDGAGEVAVHQIFVEADGFEDLRAAITLQRGDAHFREGFEEAFVDRLPEILNGASYLLRRFERQIRIYSARPIADQQGKVCITSRGSARLDDEGYLRAGFLAHQMVVNSA